MKHVGGGCMPPLSRFGQIFRRTGSAASSENDGGGGGGGISTQGSSAEDSQREEIESYLNGVSKYKAVSLIIVNGNTTHLMCM